MSLRIPIGKVIRDIRESKGISLGDMSSSTGFAKGNLSRLETKGDGISLEALENISGALKIKLSTVIKRAEDLRNEGTNKHK